MDDSAQQARPDMHREQWNLLGLPRGTISESLAALVDVAPVPLFAPATALAGSRDRHMRKGSGSM
jgi:hypothetical protein